MVPYFDLFSMLYLVSCYLKIFTLVDMRSLSVRIFIYNTLRWTWKKNKDLENFFLKRNKDSSQFTSKDNKRTRIEMVIFFPNISFYFHRLRCTFFRLASQNFSSMPLIPSESRAKWDKSRESNENLSNSPHASCQRIKWILRAV